MSLEKIIPIQKLIKTGNRWWWTAHICAGVLGVVFLAAGLIKGTDTELFIRQIKDYSIITQPVLTAILAWVLIVIECTLGTALLVFYRPRLFLFITIALLLLFIGATAWTWYIGGAEDCGCFGVFVKRTPKVTIIEDLILLIIAFFAWLSLNHLKAPDKVTNTWNKFFIVAGACWIGLLLPFVSGFPLSGLYGKSVGMAGEELGPLEIRGIDDSVDLDRGNFLFIMMGTECEHCIDAVPEVNILAEYNDLPLVIGLSFNEDYEIETFREEFDPVYPIGQIGEDDFWRLLGEGNTPRFLLVHNRYIKKIWENEVPTREDILEAISKR